MEETKSNNMMQEILRKNESTITQLQKKLEEKEMEKGQIGLKTQIFELKGKVEESKKLLEDNIKECVCGKAHADVIEVARADLSENDGTHESDMEHQCLRMAIFLIKKSIGDLSNSSFSLLAADVTRRLEEKVGGKWACVAGTLKRLVGGSFPARPGSKLEYSVGGLHLTVFSPVTQ